MQIVMFAVNSADFVYLFFIVFCCLTIWNSICLPFCPLCGRVIGISSSSVFLMLRSFILCFYFYFHLFVLRARRSGAASYLFCFVSFAAAVACFFFFSFFLRCPLTNRIALRIADVVVVAFVASIPALCHRSIEEVATVTTSILATRVNDKMLSIKSECKTAATNCSSSLSLYMVFTIIILTDL